MKKYAVIVAGGSGQRMGSNVPKQFLLLNGFPVLQYSIKAFVNTYKDIHIILVLPVQVIVDDRPLGRIVAGDAILANVVLAVIAPARRSLHGKEIRFRLKLFRPRLIPYVNRL